jgi:adenylate cyclase
MSGLIAGHRGRVVNAPGDSLLAEFASVVDAVACAVAIQDALAQRNADAHALLGYYHLLAGAHDEAIAEGERAVVLSPNHADNVANLACSCAVGGKPAEAITLIKRAMRLSPIYPMWYLNILGFAHYLCGQHDEAEQALKLALRREPAYNDCRVILAVVHDAQGRTSEARREAQEVLRHDPGFRLSNLEARLVIVKDREMVSRYLEVLRRLGLR